MNLLCPTTKPTSVSKHSRLDKASLETFIILSETKLVDIFNLNFWKCLVLSWAYMHDHNCYQSWLKL